MAIEVHREKVVSARTAGATGSSYTVATVQTIAGVNIGSFDEIGVYVAVTTNLAGTSPTMDLYLQKPIVAAPNLTTDTDADWADFLAFTQIVDAAADLWVPIPGEIVAAASKVNARTEAALTAGTLLAGHWLGPIRIREKMGGTITTPAVYNVHMVGLRRRAA